MGKVPPQLELLTKLGNASLPLPGSIISPTIQCNIRNSCVIFSSISITLLCILCLLLSLEVCGMYPVVFTKQFQGLSWNKYSIFCWSKNGLREDWVIYMEHFAWAGVAGHFEFEICVSLGRLSNNQNGNLRWFLPLGVDPPLPLNGTNFQTFFYPTFFSFAIESYIYETDFTLQKYHF